MLGPHAVDNDVVDPQFAAADVFEAGNHTQDGGLATAGRPNEDEELAIVDLKVETGNGFEPVVVTLLKIVHTERGHDLPLHTSGQEATDEKTLQGQEHDERNDHRHKCTGGE